MEQEDREFIWFNTKFYAQYKQVSSKLYEEKVLPRIKMPRINFFSPWGPRYNTERSNQIEECDTEVTLLRYLAKIFSEIRANMYRRDIHWIILGADLYGTRINGLSNDWVKKYFVSLKAWVERVMPDAKFILWSELDDQAKQYRLYAKENLSKLIGLNVWIRAKRAAKARSGDVEEYLVERLAEAMVIEEIYRPVKISLAPKGKDSDVDYCLPRLYLVPEELQTPWL